VELSIDGKHVGYRKRIGRNDSVVFDGFCIAASHTGSSHYQAFRFAKAETGVGRYKGPKVRFGAAQVAGL
jgi:hypothetical protein